MNRKPKSIVLCVLPACLLVGCQEEPAPKSPVRPVRAMKVGVAGFSGRSFPGRAKATEEVNLSFRVSGPLVALPINVGDVVKKGDVLARIDSRDYEVALRSAEANLARSKAELQAMATGARPEEIEQLKASVKRAEALMKRWQDEYDRITKLDKQGAATAIEVTRTTASRDEAEATLRRAQESLRIGQAGARKEDIEAKKAEIKSLEAAVDSAKDQLAYTSLKAPFDGSVAAKYVENYQTVQAREDICRLLDTSKVEMIVNIPEGLIANVPYVKEAVVAFDAFPDRRIEAKIKEIGTEASETTRTYPVTLIMDQPKDIKILPGMSGTARGRGKLPGDVAQAGFEVPVGAVLADKDGKTFVWLIDPKAKTAKRREVKAGKLTSRGMLVQGLEAGQWIATAGVHTLREGQQVRILDASAEEVSK